MVPANKSRYKPKCKVGCLSKYKSKFKFDFKFKSIIFICILFIIAIFPLVGRYLYFSQQPTRADAIIVLSGDAGRLEEGIRLFDQGYAKVLILTNAADFEQEPILTTIPEASIIKEYDAISTESNAARTKTIMQDHAFGSALVVTSDYHTKRTSIIFNTAFRESGIDLTFIASKGPRFDLEKWYMSPRGMKEVAREYIKLFLFNVGISQYIEKYIVSIHRSPIGFILSEGIDSHPSLATKNNGRIFRYCLMKSG